MKFKKGDTLIEVALATGIFSLVAIAVVSVVNSSTSSVQSSLEVTITREEIDAQAEALRFIHNSYLVGDDSGTSTSLSENTKYNEIWKAITSLANSNASALDYAPKTCSELYADSAKKLTDNGAFILNTHQMKTADASKIVIPVSGNVSKFTAASTYPRIVYNATDANGIGSLDNQGTGTSFYRAEGIFIIPFKDNRSTRVVSGSSSAVNVKAAYYDFYIRSCWFGPGADRPSTISTVIRLYDPEVIN